MMNNAVRQDGDEDYNNFLVRMRMGRLTAEDSLWMIENRCINCSVAHSNNVVRQDGADDYNKLLVRMRMGRLTAQDSLWVRSKYLK